MNDSDINTEAFQYVCDQNKEVGKALSNVFGITNPELFESCSDLESIISKANLMEIIINNKYVNDLFNSYTNLNEKISEDFILNYIEDETMFNIILDSEILFNMILNSNNIKNTILESENAINIMMNNENYLSYFNSISNKTTTSNITTACYLVSMKTTGSSFYANANGMAKAACSGASYVDLSGATTTLRSAVNNASSGSYSDATYTVNKLVKQFSCITANYNFESPSGSSIKYLNTTATYKSLFK